MISRSQLSFHQKFQAEFSNISKILALGAYQGTKEEISEVTGISTGKQKGKVEPAIRYGSFMGLIDKDVKQGIYTLSPTKIGEVVLREDPYLQEMLTHWLCHAHMSHPLHGAPQWNFLVHQGHIGFDTSCSNQFILEKAQIEFDSSLTFSQLFSVARLSYTEGCFHRLRFVTWEEQLEYMSHSVQDDFIFVYAYHLLSLWEELFPDKQELTIPEVDQTMGVSRTFGFNEEAWQGLLDTLVGEGVISLNRQLFPGTIIKTAMAQDMIPKLFSRLL